MNNKILLTNAVIISTGLFIENGEILIDDGQIKAVAGQGEIKRKESYTEYDLGGRIAMPGFVNPHTHLYSELATGLSPKAPADDFMSVLREFWWPLDRAHLQDSVYYSSVSGVINAVKHGVTCIFDHHASMNYVSGSLDTVNKAFSLAGLKAACCFECSDRHSNEPLQKIIEENIDFLEKHQNDKNITGMIGLHANFTLSRESLQLISDMTHFKQYPIHVHCGEDRADLEFCRNDGFEGPVDRLNHFGLLNSRSVLAHCVHLSKKDIDILKEIKPYIISNPESNANNLVGKAERKNFPAYLIGTDGMSFDMIASLRSQYLMGAGLSEDFNSLKSAFIDQPARLLKEFFPSTGRIHKGWDADIAVLDYIPNTPIDADSIMGHLIFGAKGGKVYMTVASGRILYLDGKLTFTYEASLREQIKESAIKLHRRYNG